MRTTQHVRVALPLALLLALTACGGAGSAAGGVAAPTTAASTAAPATTVAAAPVSTSTSQAATSTTAVATTSAASVAASSTAAAGGSPVSFKTDIQPIIAANCAGCHGQSGGLSLASYDSLMKGGKDGVVVKAGDADGSLIVQKVKGTQTIGARMPRGKPPLSDADIQKIADWVAQGAKDN